MAEPLPPSAEPAAYRAGGFDFRGRRFAIDRRAYVTDPELTCLVDAVVRRAGELAAALGRPPQLLDFGVGCGSLAVCVALECPAARVAGLDIDPGALELARTNLAAHGAAVALFQGDGLAALPAGFAPDLVFGDPPWGDHTTLYAPDRPIAHYLAMPAVAVFPRGGTTGCHQEILRQARARGWRCEFLLNAGSLAPAALAPVLALADEARILQPRPHVSLIHARLGTPARRGP
ncbi:MAG TPA: methyltransferase [Opitutaceae bacterium]|nr:methyltransferase [Opitutaceae bacterium]